MADTIAQTTPAGTLFGYYTDTYYAPDQKRPIKRLVQLLPGQGCSIWLDRKSDCCVFCQLPAGTRRAVLGEGFDDHFEPWTVAPDDYAAMITESLAAGTGVDSIVCFNGGSFLSDREVPALVRQQLYHGFEVHPTATELMIESRPELVKADMLHEAQDIIGDKDLKVAIGLESIDDHVRNNILKKFIGRKSFLRAIDLLRARNLKSFVYVFLGAPGLSPREAYEDAFQTIDFLAALGVDEIALSCAFIPPGGQLEKMHAAGTFRPPWLWTICQLIDDAVANDWPLSVGGFDDFPPPIAVSHNCGECDLLILGEIDNYRARGHFAQKTKCACRQTWYVKQDCV